MLLSSGFFVKNPALTGSHKKREIFSSYEPLLINKVICLADLEVATVDVRLDGRVVEHGHRHLRVRGLRAELVVRIAERLADRVDTDQGTRGKEVLALEGASAHRVLLRPHGVHVLGQELARGQLVTRVAARRALRIAELGRARDLRGEYVTALVVRVLLDIVLTLGARRARLTRLGGVVRCGREGLETLLLEKARL